MDCSSAFNHKAKCYELVNEAGWSVKNLVDVLRENNYSNYFHDKILINKIFVNALIYAKKNDYVDLIVLRMIRKNGNEFAMNIFKSVFKDFNSLSDLYDYCFRYLSQKDSSSELDNLGINGTIIRYYAKESKLGILKEDKIRIDKKKSKVKDKYPVYYNAINFLLTHEKEKDIIQYFSKIDKSFNSCYLLSFANSLLQDMPLDEIKKKVIDKYHIYTSYNRNIIQANSEKIKEASMIVDEFVNGVYPNIRSFLVIRNISKEKFKNNVAIVKRNNDDLYKDYKTKMEKVKNGEYPVQFMELRKIVDYLLFGIDGREFTILDYLKMTKYTVHDFYYLVVNCLNEKEYEPVRNFYLRYRYMKLISKDAIKDLTYEVNCQYDENGFPIQNTGHAVTDKEKDEIIDKIKNDGFALYEPVYYFYVKKYFENKKDCVLKKTL